MGSQPAVLINSCREENSQGVCRCDEGYGDGNPYLRYTIRYIYMKQ